MTARFASSLALVTDEGTAAEIRRRRIAALGERSQARLAREVGVHRNTIINAEKGEVDHITAAAIFSTLDRLEHRQGRDDPDKVLTTITLPSGVELTFSGPESDVADEVERYFAQRRDRET